MTLNRICILLLAAVFSTFLVSCDNDDDDVSLRGSASIEITDAPIDDASISGAFVTIAEVKVDGKSIEGFSKTTIDLMTLQNGNTRLLTNSELDAKSYNNVSLVLDYETDANGNSPGCYVEEDNGNTKHKLSSTTNEITLNHDFVLEAENQTDLVIDFDLRKCIKREQNASDEFEFVSESEMESGIRVVNKSRTGIVQGNCNDAVTSSDKIVVYAYKKGDYDRDTEVSGQGQSNVEFANAVTSATVDANGNFELHFLEEGDYELHYCSYEENNSGEMELKGTLIVDVIGSLNITSLSVNASASLSVDVLVTGIVQI